MSRILGLARDIVLARLFGATIGADAFFVSFRIPNFLRRLFAEGAFSQAFVPVLSEYEAQRDHSEVRRLVDDVSGILGGILFLITLLGVIAAPLLVIVFAPGFLQEQEVEKYSLTVQMIRITFPYLLFISLTALAGSILNTYDRFSVPAFTPVLLNISLITAALFIAPHLEQPVMALAWGVFVAGIAQLLFQLPFLARLRLLPRPRLGLANDGVRRIGRLMLPAIFGSSVVQINLLFDTLIASFLVTGSISWLYYSDRLVEFPLGVFGIALATVVLPALSRARASHSGQEYHQTMDWALKLVFIIGAPATTGLFVLAGPLLTAIFQYGEFAEQDVQMTQLSLMAYAAGLPGFILVKVLATGFYSRQDTRTPVRIGIVAMLANMILNVAFVVPLVRAGFAGPHMGLALATSLSAYLNAALLYHRLRRDGVYRPLPAWRRILMTVTLSCLGMAALLVWGMADMTEWLAWDWHQRLVKLAFLVTVGVVSYFLLLVMLGLRPSHLHVHRSL